MRTPVKTVAVLLDAGYLRKRFRRVGVALSPENILTTATTCVDPEKEELFRIYYYDCMPYEGKHRHPITQEEHDFAESRVCKVAKGVLARLRRRANVAFREGHLSFQGWRLRRQALKDFKKGRDRLRPEDVEPDFRQKGVDIRIGLDIAWLASKGIVDKVVLVARDQDFVPAMEFARREGMLVAIVSLGEESLPQLEEHADEIRRLDLSRLVTPSSEVPANERGT